jgi:hypothetical protein
MKDREERCDVETFEVESAPGVFLPGFLFVPRPDAPKRPLLLMLEPGGRTRHWREGDLYQQLAALGFLVCAFDVRGIGDLAPEVGRGNAGYTTPHATEEAYAWASLILGRPLLGQRVEDILAMAHAVQDWRGAGRDLVLAANGPMTVPALCAAALDPVLTTTYLVRGLVSWSSLLEGDAYTEPFSNFLPGVLTKTDLPFVARLASPGKIVLAGAVDARNLPVPIGSVRALYGDGVEVRGNATWDVKTFSAF